MHAASAVGFGVAVVLMTGFAGAQGTRPASGVSLADLSWMDAEPFLTTSSVVVIPLGAAVLEQGPHLKLNLEVLLLAAFSIPAWAARVNPPAPLIGDALVVRVTGQQFSWTIQYPGPDGQFGRVDASLLSAENPAGLDRASAHGADDVISVNQMHLPIGRPVIVQLSSRDVIHSFGVPAMRVKQDAIPGMMIPVWFTPTLAGSFDIACSQLCGLGHYRMRASSRSRARASSPPGSPRSADPRQEPWRRSATRTTSSR